MRLRTKRIRVNSCMPLSEIMLLSDRWCFAALFSAWSLLWLSTIHTAEGCRWLEHVWHLPLQTNSLALANNQLQPCHLVYEHLSAWTWLLCLKFMREEKKYFIFELWKTLSEELRYSIEWLVNTSLHLLLMCIIGVFIWIFPIRKKDGGIYVEMH